VNRGLDPVHAPWNGQRSGEVVVVFGDAQSVEDVADTVGVGKLIKQFLFLRIIPERRVVIIWVAHSSEFVIRMDLWIRFLR
jgi:hypothetical protein